MKKASCILGVLVALLGLSLLATPASAQPPRGGYPGHHHQQHGGHYRNYGRGYAQPVYVAPAPCYRPVRPVPLAYPVPVAPAPVLAPAPLVQPGFSFSLFFGR
ncbi:MAG: hypothetical protein AB7K24_24995 [Gemmataceae bacterium]